MKRRAFWVFLLAALLYTWRGFLPGRVLLPLDLRADFGAWKPDATRRQPVSNRLLSDAVLQFVPWDVAASRALARGEVPWRNALSGDGAPLFANPQAALLSPFTWPRLVFGLRGWAVSVFLKLLVAGAGAFWLAREMGAQGGAAMLSGFVYLASGFSIVWGLHPHTNVFALLPALAATLLHLLRAVTRVATLRVVLLAAAATLGGHPETLAIGMAGIGGLLVWEILAERRSSPVPARGIFFGLAAALTGFCLAAVQLVPFLLLLQGSYAAATRPGAAVSALRGWSIVGQALPGVLGGPLAGELDLSPALPGSGSFLTRSEGFLGAIILVALLASFRRLSPIFRRGLVVGFAAMVLAWCPPLLAGAWRALPLFGVAGQHYCFLVFALFGAAAAGPALASLAARPPRETWRLAAGLFGAGLLVTVIGLAPSLPAGEAALRRAAGRGVAVLHARGVLKNPETIYRARLEEYLTEGRATAARRLALPGLFWLVGGVGLAVSRRRPMILAFAAIGELAAFGAGYLPAVKREQIPAEPLVARDLARADPQRRFLLASFEGIYPPNLATLDGLRDIRRHDELESREWALALQANGYRRGELAFLDPLPPEAVRRLARTGVRYYFARAAVAESVRIGGDASPAVGLYEVAGASARPLPDNIPPRGFRLGLLVSVAALLAAVLLIWRSRESMRQT